MRRHDDAHVTISVMAEIAVEEPDEVSMDDSDESSDDAMDVAAPRSSKQAKKTKKGQKQKIRDIKRLLKRDDLSATVRQAQERMLALLQNEVKETDRLKKFKKMSKKYKMVKFFDRRKVARKLKAARRQKTENEAMEELKKDYNYAVHFPLDKKYISLHPPPNEKEREKQLEIRENIDELVKSGQLDDASMEILEGTRREKSRKRRGYVSQGEKDHHMNSSPIMDTDTTKDDFFM